MTRRSWAYAPDSGGVKTPDRTKAEVRERLTAYAAQNYAGRYERLDIRFRAQFCYVGAVLNAGGAPMQLCRLRHFRVDRWTVGFFKYSTKTYELCFVDAAGGFECTAEQGFAVAADVYLSDG